MAPPSASSFLRLRHVRGKPIEFLADIGLGGEHDRLLVQAVGIEAFGGRQQRRHLLGEPRLDRFRLAAGRSLGARRKRRDLVEPGRQQTTERRALLAAHGDQCGQRLFEARSDCAFCRAMSVLAFVFFGDFDHAFE